MGAESNDLATEPFVRDLLPLGKDFSQSCCAASARHWQATLSNAESPGLCGWGVVTAYNEEDITGKLAWRPVPPSDQLKMRPLLNEQLEARIDKIRGPMPRGTLWPVERKDAAWIAELIPKGQM